AWEPSSAMTKPKPLSASNHFTRPVGMMSFLLMAPASERVVLVPGAGGYVPGSGESVVRKRVCRVEAVAAFCPVALGGEPRGPETARPESIRPESVRVDLKRWESASA